MARGTLPRAMFIVRRIFFSSRGTVPADMFPADTDEPSPIDAPPVTPAGVVVLHEVSGVMAVLKPAGLATQAVVGVDSMEARVRRLLQDRGDGIYLGVPHRLDRCVSGVMLFATTRRAARKLARQFERREIVKRYLALVQPPGSGRLPKVGDRWVDLLAKVQDEPRGCLASASDPSAKEACTAVVAVWRAEAAIAVELQPETGRMHQLRIQAASRSMPILGDRLYGSTQPLCGGEVVTDVRQEEIALAAISIEFTDPGQSGVPGSEIRRRVEYWPWWAKPRPVTAGEA
jgi:23S rRNA pseudouridine1911/1915/1917 synthase